jgi:hypothetical protein
MVERWVASAWLLKEKHFHFMLANLTTHESRHRRANPRSATLLGYAAHLKIAAAWSPILMLAVCRQLQAVRGNRTHRPHVNVASARFPVPDNPVYQVIVHFACVGHNYSGRLAICQICRLTLAGAGKHRRKPLDPLATVDLAHIDVAVRTILVFPSSALVSAQRDGRAIHRDGTCKCPLSHAVAYGPG